MLYQRTIQKKATVRGVGLHTGEPAALSFCPAPTNFGIHFVRKDLPGQPALSVQAKNVQATARATTLGGPHFSVSTVEHCLSSLSALRIDNLIIELEGPEIPIGDGSAKPFLDAISQAGIVEQDQVRKYAYVTQPIYLGEDDKHVYVVPYNGLRITCTISFPHPIIGDETLDLDIDEHVFQTEVAPARTFGFLKEVEALKAKGLILGGSLENAVVLDTDKVVNPEGLRFKDEFVRHKMLDTLGDLVTLGAPLMGHIVLYKTGHDMMNKFIHKIHQSPDCVKYVELGSDPQTQYLKFQYS